MDLHKRVAAGSIAIECVAALEEKRGNLFDYHMKASEGQSGCEVTDHMIRFRTNQKENQ